MDLKSRMTELGIRPVMGPEFFIMGDAEIAALERKLAVRLPETYRKFLATYGAAGFHSYVNFRSRYPLPPYLSKRGEGHIAFFYGPASDAYETSYSLAAKIRAYSERMPENLIPIGGDGFGDQICLGIRGDETGKIYYWDHDNEWDEEDYLEDGLPVPPDLKFQNVHLIADSFEDFIERLYIDES